VHACEEGPLIGPRIEIGIEEHAVSPVPRLLLHGRAIRPPKPPFGSVSWLGKSRS
jgi:hypothetical protein